MITVNGPVLVEEIQYLHHNGPSRIFLIDPKKYCHFPDLLYFLFQVVGDKLCVEGRDNDPYGKYPTMNIFLINLSWHKKTIFMLSLKI